MIAYVQKFADSKQINKIKFATGSSLLATMVTRSSATAEKQRVSYT